MSVREQLRDATSGVHEALHALGPFARIERGEIGPDEYADLLIVLYRFHAGIAPAFIAGCVAIGAGDLVLQGNRRVDDLRRDLAFLDRRADTPPLIDVTAMTTAFAAGCAYTVQGSTLGGKVLHRQLAHFLPGEDGRRFFGGAAEDGEHWRIFCEKLEKFGNQDNRLNDIVSGAIFAFDFFRSCIEVMNIKGRT